MAHQYTPPDKGDLLLLAGALARVAHSGQVRSGGEPYIAHASRVSASAFESDARGNYTGAILGYLHDVVEDTVVTLRGLRELFPQEIVDGVALLTRGEDELYTHFIHRLIRFGSDDVLTVKLADLADNLRDLDQSSFSLEKRAVLRERWTVTLEKILAEQDRRGTDILPHAA